MQIANALRRLAASSRQGRIEYAQERHRLTVDPIADMPGYLGFTLREARARGWMPVLAGQITEADDIAISFCASPEAVADFDRLTGALLAERAPLSGEPPRAPERERPRGRALVRRLPA